MQTECNTRQLGFQGVGRRGVVAKFDGGNITSDAGGLLLREVDNGLGLSKRCAECFTDYRDEKSIEHLLLFNEENLSLGLKKKPFSPESDSDLAWVTQYVRGDETADLQGMDVFEFLADLAAVSASDSDFNPRNTSMYSCGKNQGITRRCTIVHCTSDPVD